MNKKIIGGATLLAAGLIAGSFAGISGASATETATSVTPVVDTQAAYPTTTTPVVTPTTPAAPTADATKPAHTPETAVTGDLATELSNLALAKYPGATVDRVENDTDGATFEVHLTLADGSHVTVKFDADKNITATETGPAFGSPKRDHDGDHKGGKGHHGDRDGDDDGDDDAGANSFSSVTPLNG